MPINSAQQLCSMMPLLWQTWTCTGCSIYDRLHKSDFTAADRDAAGTR